MTGYTLKPTLTKNRLEWLRILLKGKTKNRGQHHATNHCLRLGWAVTRFHVDGTYHYEITEAGRAALRGEA